MTIRKILTEPDPFLRKKSQAVDKVNDEILLFGSDETLHTLNIHHKSRNESTDVLLVDTGLLVLVYETGNLVHDLLIILALGSVRLQNVFHFYKPTLKSLTI